MAESQASRTKARGIGRSNRHIQPKLEERRGELMLIPAVKRGWLIQVWTLSALGWIIDSDNGVTCEWRAELT